MNACMLPPQLPFSLLIQDQLALPASVIVIKIAAPHPHRPALSSLSLKLSSQIKDENLGSLLFLKLPVASMFPSREIVNVSPFSSPSTCLF